MSRPGPAYRGSVSPLFLGLGVTRVTFLSHCRQGIGWSENMLLVPKVLFLEGRSSRVQTDKVSESVACAVRGPRQLALLSVKIEATGSKCFT